MMWWLEIRNAEFSFFTSDLHCFYDHFFLFLGESDMRHRICIKTHQIHCMMIYCIYEIILDGTY